MSRRGRGEYFFSEFTNFSVNLVLISFVKISVIELKHRGRIHS